LSVGSCHSPTDFPLRLSFGRWFWYLSFSLVVQVIRIICSGEFGSNLSGAILNY
jgi:hypothetical protein